MMRPEKEEERITLVSAESDPSAYEYSAGDIQSSKYFSDGGRSRTPRVLRRFLFEILMAWRITVGDFPATVIPYLCAGIGIFLVAALPVRELPILLLKIIAYGFLYIYAFTTVNQLASAEEDRANKPHRPLTQGLITRRWMIRHSVVTNILFGAIGFLFSIPWPTVLWLVLIHLHNFRGTYRHWFFKNIVFISVGAGVELTATWGLVSPPVALPWSWICVTSLLAGIGCNSQDIRDVAGDRLAGRKTMSIAWGEDNARIALALFLFAIPRTPDMAH